MSHGQQTSKWIQADLPMLYARGPEAFDAVIEQAIRNKRHRRFWTVLIVILVPAVVVNIFHADIIALLDDAISLPALLAISVIIAAVVAAKLSAKVLHLEIEKLACETAK